MPPHRSDRWVLTAALLILSALVLVSYGGGQSTRGREPELYAPNLPLDAELLRMDRHALEVAYEEQVRKLFSVWLTSQAGDSTHFRNGMRIARKAYDQATTAIAKREQELGIERRQDEQRK